MTACVDLVESVDSAVCGNALFLNLEQVFGTIKSICVYRSALILTGKFHARTFRTSAGSCFFRSKEESPWLSALARYSV